MSDTLGLARVHGRGSYKVSPTLKKFATRMLDEGRLKLVVDVERCEGMDSTFMGTLAGISQRLTKAGGEPVYMTSVSPKLHQLMKTLGLDRLVRIQPESWKAGEATETLSEPESPELGSLESAEHILEAHETLVEISPENLSKFEDCLLYLRQDVQNRKG
jgi:anti-anti-sigma factor